MQLPAVLIGLLAITGIALFYTENYSFSLEASQVHSDYQKYQEWTAKYGRNDISQERFLAFQGNLRFIEEFNARSDVTSTVGLNKFADLTNEEYIAQYLTKIVKSDSNQYHTPRIAGDYDKTINWVQEGAVTSVKDQGVCGSCWAFSAVASLEAAYFFHSGNLTNLSEQQVVSCTPYPYSYGCGGGQPLAAFEYTADKGIEPAEAYPYVQASNVITVPCHSYDRSKVVYQNLGGQQLKPQFVQGMMSQLQQQPISVAIDASPQAFQLYTSGILQESECPEVWLNHAVTIVGYDHPQDFWTIKNSWGTGWGDEGYIKFFAAGGAGVCGVNENPTFPYFK